MSVKIYFLGDLLKNWAVRLMIIMNVPIALTVLFTWYARGFTEEFFIRLTFLCVVFFSSVMFILIGYVKGRRLSNRQAKKLYK